MQFAGAEGARVPEPSDPAGALEVGNVPYRAILRKGGDDGVTSYRIPGLAVTTSGALIAVYDARWDGSGDLPANIDVALRRSTDRGVTWSAQQIILDFDKNVPGSSGNGVGDPCILVDRDTGAIWVAAFWSYGNHGYVGSGAGLSTNQTGQYVLTRSDDDGLTWSPPINITEQVKANTNWGAVLQGPGAGIQLRDGTLVFPSQCTLPGGASARAFFAYSTNHGASWRVSPPANPTVPPQFNENQLVELDDGRLMVSARVPGSSNKLRAWATYTPGVPVGSGTWSSITYANPDPICQASFCRYGSARDGHPRSRLLFANPAATSARTNMTIRLSEDEGQTWPVSRVLNPKPSGYSCLAVLDDGTVGLLYETGESSSIENLTFARFTLDWLTRADVDSDGDGISDYYESANGLSNGLSDAAGDLDGDGATNLDEFRAGTLANDFASVLQMDGLAVTGAVRVAWRSVPWRNYAVEESAEASESWTPAAGGVVTAISGRCATVAAASEAVIRFFRVSALP